MKTIETDRNSARERPGRRAGFTLIEMPFDKLSSSLSSTLRLRPEGSLRAEGRAVRKRKSAAFTLIEMLTIITIIALLLGISLPTILGVWRSARVQASHARINLIEGACRQYYNDFGDFPLSNWGKPADDILFPPDEWYLPDWQGRELLPLFLVGYGGDAGVPGKPLDSGKFNTDDGHDGNGFRTIGGGRGGYVYGPYNNVETVDTAMTSNSIPAFIDEFEQEIFYYRFDEASGAYNAGDNSGGPGDINNYAKDKDGAGKYFRRDFILMTKGLDGEWEAFRDDPTTDDITNFLEEQ